jgi:hypothetical protein
LNRAAREVVQPVLPEAHFAFQNRHLKSAGPAAALILPYAVPARERNRSITEEAHAHRSEFDA